MIEIFLALDKIQQWVLLISAIIGIGSVLYFIFRNGFKYKEYEFRGFIEEKIEQIVPVHQKQVIWEKNIEIKQKHFFGYKTIIIGKIGFVKDIVIYKFFGSFWNSADPISKEGYDRFSFEFNPPRWIDKPEELEAFVFVENANIQSKLLSIIINGASNWKHVYVIGSWQQIAGQELDLLKNSDYGNISVISAPRTNNDF